jgi:hypothetical protein
VAKDSSILESSDARKTVLASGVLRMNVMSGCTVSVLVEQATTWNVASLKEMETTRIILSLLVYKMLVRKQADVKTRVLL